MYTHGDADAQEQEGALCAALSAMSNFWLVQPSFWADVGMEGRDGGNQDMEEEEASDRGHDGWSRK